MHRPREISTTGELEILAPLSVGGMGEVYLARRRGAHGFSKLIALKTIRPDLLQHEEMRRMFLDEANLLARLDHPAVAQVYDFVEKDGGLYLSMEYVPGVPISKLMQKRQTPVPGPIVARIGVEVCRGLHAAHELTDLDGSLLGVVHRDISPQNVMLTFDGRVKILDFGVAFMFEREATTTQTGLFKGKLAYIAPEQIAGKGADRRSDIYSLAVVMHELLTGRRLFSKGKGALADATNRKRVPKPSTVAPDVPRELEDIVMKGLKGQQRSRFPDAKEMAAALESYLHTAGGESLEAFAERELDDEKEHHRGWLQTVMESPTGPTATQRDETKPDRHVSRTGGGPPPLPEKSVEIPVTPPLIMESELVSFVPEKPRRSGRLIGLSIIIAALTAGAWLLFPSKVEQNASRFANWASDEARPMITNALEDGAEAFDDDPEIDRTEQERIEEADPEAVEVEEPEQVVEPPAEALTPTQAAKLIGEQVPPPPPVAEAPPPSAVGEAGEPVIGESGEKLETPPIPKLETVVVPVPEKRAVQKRAVQKRARSKPPTKMLYGSLSIMARPGGTVVVDGKRVGNTPLNRVRLKPGRHRVALMRGREPKPRWASTVWVREGRHVMIKLK